jgi:hypothetical protein
MKKLPQSFQNFFWEYNLRYLNIYKHKRLIIERILDRGRMEQIKELFKIYSKSEIEKVIMKSPNLSKTTRRFWHTIFQFNE